MEGHGSTGARDHGSTGAREGLCRGAWEHVGVLGPGHCRQAYRTGSARPPHGHHALERFPADPAPCDATPVHQGVDDDAEADPDAGRSRRPTPTRTTRTPSSTSRPRASPVSPTTMCSEFSEDDYQLPLESGVDDVLLDEQLGLLNACPTARQERRPAAAENVAAASRVIGQPAVNSDRRAHGQQPGATPRGARNEDVARAPRPAGPRIRSVVVNVVASRQASPPPPLRYPRCRRSRTSSGTTGCSWTESGTFS